MTAPTLTLGSPLVGQLRTFVLIGVVSTLAYLGLYSMLRGVVSAGPANAIALVATAAANTTANRRLTFDVRGRSGLARDQLAGFLALGVALLITSASIAVLGVAAPRVARAAELVVLIAANGVATLIRFALLRSWIGRREPSS